MVDTPCKASPEQWFGENFVVTDDNRMVGYFSLTVKQIDTTDVPERIRKGMGQYPVPVAILARLAVSIQDHGRGIGRGMLQDAIRRTLFIAEQAGIRAMLTHPIDDAAIKFYARFGLVYPHRRERNNYCCCSRMHAKCLCAASATSLHTLQNKKINQGIKMSDIFTSIFRNTFLLNVKCCKFK